MENEAPKDDAENLPENGVEKAEEKPLENLSSIPAENQAADQGGQMTLESMTAEVSKIYAGFDPEKHAVNPDGTPKKRADGQWASKRGRKPGQTAASVSPAAQTSAPAPGGTAPLSAKKAREAGVITNEAAARQTVALVVTALGSTLGDEWNFETPEEADNMRAAVKAYYDANGQVAISPELMLSFQVFAYAAPRSQHPNTKAKLSAAWSWCKNLFKIGG